MKLVIQNGRLLDPSSEVDREVDIIIEDGTIRDIVTAGSAPITTANLIDAKGKWVTPGLVDLHVHLREPGCEYKEDIASGSRAAAAGGFTSVVAMANTQPVIDSAELVRSVAERGAEVGLCRVLPVGAVTMGQGGETLAPFAEMARAGAVAVSDDGQVVKNPELMRRALEYAMDHHDLPLLTHADEPALNAGGFMHEGNVSTRLGLRGIPGVAEDVAVARDVALACYTGGRLHVCHVSTAAAVQTIRDAKARGVRVTAEATPHHFALTHAAVEGYDTATKMVPPLRTEEDRRAIVLGLRDGTIDAIATDHAPHSSIEKDVTFADAANGIIGLQTALPLTLDLWRAGELPLLIAIARLTSGPAAALGLSCGTVAVGAVADLAVIDPEASWRLDHESNYSKSVNSPFWNRPLTGRTDATILGGEVVYRRDRQPVWSTM
ncbi:MAG: dihydroorotase [Myxococcota bacterium]